MNKTTSIITTLITAFAFTTVPSYSTECSTSWVGDPCGRPSNVRTCENRTYDVNCGLIAGHKTYHVCNTTWIEFTASRQDICYDAPSGGSDCSLVDFRCGYKRTGACQPANVYNCSVGGSISIEGITYNSGTSLSVITACFQVDGSEPEEIPGGKQAAVTANPNCTPTPTPTPTPNPE